MGLTGKPCPGCRKEYNGQRFRETGHVCGECKQLLAEAAEHRKNQEELGNSEGMKKYVASVHYSYGKDKLPVFGVQPSFYPSTRFAAMDSDVRDRLGKAFWALAKNFITIPDQWEHPSEGIKDIVCKNEIDLFVHTYDDSRVVLAHEEHREQIQELFKQILLGLASAYAQGYENGENVLSKLSRGDVSINELNDLHVNNTTIQKYSTRGY